MGNIKDLSDKKFGKLTVLGFDKLDREKGLAIWLCQCECGNKKLIDSQVIKKCVSCGCYRNKLAGDRIRGIKTSANTKNEGIYVNGIRHPAYCSWTGMKARCYTKTSINYRWYGARGISVCDEWKNNPEVFIKWAQENGYKKGLCLDRIDVNGNYEPSNCQFLTKDQNLRKVRTDNIKKGYTYSRNRIPS